MTLDDLARTLGEALATGRIGTPVSLRAHVIVPEEGADLDFVFDRLMHWLAAPLFGTPDRLSARGDPDGRLLNVLASYAAGPTALVTLGRAGSTPRLDLLVVGNHGVLRLEGGECFAGVNGGDTPSEADRHSYGRTVAASLRTGHAVAHRPEPTGAISTGPA